MKPGGEVRIIGGLWKRSKLPVANLPGLRPTPDRVRETLFNWLGQNLTGWHCIDPFAGTGVLGFEAASRGAESVLLGESSSLCIEVMQKNKERLKAACIRLQRGDGLSMLRQQAANSLDLVFLDPPYDFPHYDSALQSARAGVKTSGFVYLESAKAWSPETMLTAGWNLHRHLKAGAVHAHLLQPAA
ncbi:MAG: 16S rRNA (guanine(966)-N(2))-methyltransferase RsmD [Limnohabitans sp.]|nr:16S rRNA (guanine(966)-N(2))-methyltransferase RsmD [Limnohabitans sp.]